MAERVLTLRELNRATLARQLLLERRRLSPKAVIERLVGMQAQWPPAPYVGIWTRTTGFRRQALERELASGRVVKANVMRQTLHLVTPHDYGLVRAAMSETNYPWEMEPAIRLAPSVRALAEQGAVTTTEALVYLEREHGLTGITARRAWRAARARAHLLHHHETALWRGRPEGRFVPVDEPEAHDPTEARAEIFRRYLAAFGPASRRDLVAWSSMHVPEIDRALERMEPLRRFRDEQGRDLYDVPRAPLPDPETPAPVRFLPKWDNVLLAWADRTRVLPEPYRKTSSARTATSRRRFSSTASSPACGASTTGASSSSRSRCCHARCGASSRTRPRAWRRSSPIRAGARSGCGPLCPRAVLRRELQHDERARPRPRRVRLRRELERAACARPRRRGDEVRVDDLAGRVDDLVLEVRLERVGGAGGMDRVRDPLERERRLDEDRRRLVLEVGARIVLCRRSRRESRWGTA